MSDNVSGGETDNDLGEPRTFVEGIDYYYDDGLMVLTRRYLLERGTCCNNGCRHCPFEKDVN